MKENSPFIMVLTVPDIWPMQKVLKLCNALILQTSGQGHIVDYTCGMSYAKRTMPIPGHLQQCKCTTGKLI